MESSFGQMVGSTRDIGGEANNMGEAFIKDLMEWKEKGNGKKGKKLNGWMNDYFVFFL